MELRTQFIYVGSARRPDIKTHRSSYHVSHLLKNQLVKTIDKVVVGQSLPRSSHCLGSYCITSNARVISLHLHDNINFKHTNS